jgi:hypothetical protein
MPGCRSKRSDGKPCGANPGQNGYCFSHDPERAGEAAAARLKGGRHRKRGKPRDPNAPPPDLSTPAAVLAYIADCAAEAECLDLSPGKVKARLQAATTAWEVLEKVRTDARLRRIERALGLEELTLEETDSLGGLNVGL